MKKAILQLGWKKNSLKTPLGFPVKNKGTSNIRDLEKFNIGGEGHMLTIAPTGKGKGRNVIIPTLLNYPGSILIIDPKGEAAAVTARRRKEFGKVVILDPFKLVKKRSDRLNPMEVCNMLPQSTEQNAMMLTEQLHHGYQGFKSDPYWDNTADALISGLIAHILDDKPNNQRNFATLRNMLAQDDIDYSLAVILDTMGKSMNKFAYQEISQYLQIPSDKTRPCVLSTAQQHIKIFGDPSVCNVVKGESTFDVNAFIEGEPMTIYIVIPPTKLRTHSALLRLWISSLLFGLLERTSLPEIPTLFMIDETAQLGKIEAIRTAKTLIRGYGVRVWSFWQDLSQIKRLYPEDWTTIVNNSDLIQIFGVTTNMMANELIQVVGKITSETLLDLPENEMIMALPPGRVEKVYKMDYLKDAIFQNLYDKHPMFDKKSNLKSVKKTTRQR